VASSSAGLIVSQTGDGPLENYERLGYVVSAAIVTTVVLMFKIDRMITSTRSPGLAPPVVASESTLAE
jgi:hypothetical protein